MTVHWVMPVRFRLTGMDTSAAKLQVLEGGATQAEACSPKLRVKKRPPFSALASQVLRF